MPTCNRYELPTSVNDRGTILTFDPLVTQEYNIHKSLGLLRLDMDDRGLKWMRVNVLSKKLRVRTNLLATPRQPSVFIFTCKKS